MSYTKTTWTNNSGSKINATNLNKIEQGIYDNDAKITDLSTYSTTEQEVGTWIDGKTIYRKVVDLGAIGSSNAFITKTVSGSYDAIVNFSGYAYNPDTGTKIGTIYKLTSGNDYINISYTVSSNALTVDIARSNNSVWSNYYIKVVIEYTKP